MQHLDEGTIHAWLDGALPPLEAEHVAKHAADCAICATAVAEARGIIAGAARVVSALDDVPGGVIPSSRPAATPVSGTSLWRRLRLTPGRAALAATILLAVSATLTLRMSRSPSAERAGSSVGAVVQRPVQTTLAPTSFPTTVDSIKMPGPSARAVNASGPARAVIAANVPQPQAATERRVVADALTPRDTNARDANASDANTRNAITRDTSLRDAAKTRAALQEATAGAPAAVAAAQVAPASPSAALMKANSAARERAVEGHDSVSTFEGCYRLSADSAAGSTEMPRGLPTTFTLSRSSADPRTAPRRFADARGDSAVVPVAWQRVSMTQANVTFASGSAGPVSLRLTAGSPVGVASSGERITTVRVVRSPCRP